MKQSLARIIEEAILLERKVGELYRLFYTRFPEDSEFWWKLAMEEENHAALLKTVLQMDSIHLEIPPDFLPGQLEELQQSVDVIHEALERFATGEDRTEAFRLALKVENSAGELHYDTFMQSIPDSSITRVFQKLNREDKGHARRIREYMDQQGITEQR